MAILITGGCGYIGSHTCIELLAAGYDIVVVARHRAVDADYHEIAQCLQKQMDKLGLIRKETTHEAADAVSDPVLPE